jgi:hypothetical protein
MISKDYATDTEEMLRSAFEAAQARIQTALPAIVTAVDLGAQTISAQPAVQGVFMDPATRQRVIIDLPLLVDVPICYYRGGGFAITVPLSVGDEVLVIFASRCIDAWWQSGGVQPQAELRMHDLSDGFAVLAPVSQPRKLAGVSPTALELRALSGTAKITIAQNAITLNAPTITVSGSLTINGGAYVDHKHTGIHQGNQNSGGVYIP